MLQTIQTLADIRGRCASQQPLTHAQCTLLADSLDRYLSHDCTNLNEAFGIVNGRGGVAWWMERAIRNRDDALRVLASNHLSDLSVYRQAKEIARLADRYASLCWPRDREIDAMPDRYRDAPQEQLWAAFRSGAAMPISERRLRTILGD